MTIVRKFIQVGGSVAIVVPKDFAESMGADPGSEARMTLVGRQLVVEPNTDTMPQDTFRRAYATVLRKYAQDFEALARYDET